MLSSVVCPYGPGRGLCCLVVLLKPVMLRESGEPKDHSRQRRPQKTTIGISISIQQDNRPQKAPDNPASSLRVRGRGNIYDGVTS